VNHLSHQHLDRHRLAVLHVDLDLRDVVTGREADAAVGQHDLFDTGLHAREPESRLARRPHELTRPRVVVDISGKIVLGQCRAGCFGRLLVTPATDLPHRAANRTRHHYSDRDAQRSTGPVAVEATRRRTCRWVGE